MSATSTGVPTLRSALRRAARLGAKVERVHATGEVRVTHGDTRLTINARRKDATRELTALVAELEANHPTLDLDHARREYHERAHPNANDPTIQPIAPAMTFAERLRRHLYETIEPDAEGWRPYSSADIADELGVTSTMVAATVNHAEAAGFIERKRDPGGRLIIGVRFLRADGMADPKARTLRGLPAIRAEAREANGATQPEPEPEPAPRAIPLGPSSSSEPVGMLPVPHLRTYAEAHKLARTNPLLKVEPSEAELIDILHDAARLYWWVRASK